jgi:hypothetical protein
VKKEDMQWTFIDAKLAEGAFFRVNFIGPVRFADRLAGTNLQAAPALVAHPNFKSPGFRKSAFNVDGCLLRIVLPEVGKTADDFAE